MLTTLQLRDQTIDSADTLISHLESLKGRLKHKIAEYGPERIRLILDTLDRWIAIMEKSDGRIPKELP